MKFTRVFAFMALAGLAGSAYATNGYFGHGYGMKAKGMAGVSTTNTDDAFGGANNPASMAYAGNRLELGVDLFSPRREASRSGSGFVDGSVDSDSNYFLIPELGYNKMINPNLALGVTVYGNGGMNTNYSAGQPASTANCGFVNPGPAPYNLLCGNGRLGVDLMQLVIAPTAAFKIAPNHSIGVSPLLGYQRFKAEGLQAFGVANAAGGNLGYDDSFGYGVRMGYLGKITPTVTIGAAYASKMKFDEFDKYSGLFAEQGSFDIPSNYNMGVAWQATPAVKLALDYQRINYSDINAIANPVASPGALGDNNGPGFGWDDAKVWKLGVEYKHSPKMTFRAGYSHTNSPIKGDATCATTTNCGETTFNILAPAVIEDHVTLGFTHTLASGSEVTVAYMHAFKNDVSGADQFGGSTKIQMYQNSLGIQYGWKM
ncbi:MAG: long-chain fatty acid transporter [Hydrogenophilales bacterium 17-61-9]|nr:MAG: long-chain fatty acid transporter [Hydrogenophilales bacterium 17-61-9]